MKNYLIAALMSANIFLAWTYGIHITVTQNRILMMELRQAYLEASLDWGVVTLVSQAKALEREVHRLREVKPEIGPGGPQEPHTPRTRRPLYLPTRNLVGPIPVKYGRGQVVAP